ncbi:MAG: hypothetical protein RJA48_1664, partial [Verrucomicrobiota bacterium]
HDGAQEHPLGAEQSPKRGDQAEEGFDGAQHVDQSEGSSIFGHAATLGGFNGLLLFGGRLIPGRHRGGPNG